MKQDRTVELLAIGAWVIFAVLVLSFLTGMLP